MTEPDERDDSTAARMAAAVLAVDDVAALSAGPAGQFRTYLPGGRSVAGVREDSDGIEIDVVVRYGPSLPQLGEQIAAAVAPWAGGRPVTVSVADIVLPGEPGPADPADDPASDPADSEVDHDPRDGHGNAT